MTIVDVIAWLLLALGMLPVLTAWVLRKYRDSPSRSLRDRWHVALVLALVGVVAAFLAANRLFEWGLRGEVIALPLGGVLLAVDLISGKWLWEYMTGSFSDKRDWPETEIEEQDRHVGDRRRALQAETDKRDGVES